MGRLHLLKEQLDSKKISAREATDSFLKLIQERNPKLNAYVEVFETQARAVASEVDSGKKRGALAGIPLGIKDMIGMRGEKLEACSKMLSNFRAPRSATVTERLEKAGAVFLGRLNCDEFAMGSSNENSFYGSVKNPEGIDRTAGGSSGGSVASVRAELCAGSLGTDTGGSIRLPAAFCGVTGLKPTYGRVSRSGVVAFASSLDQVGPVADDALDCAHIFQAIAGRDARDATTLPIAPGNYIAAAQKPSLKGLKIGIPKEFFVKGGMEPEVERATQAAMSAIEKEGATLKEISLPHTEYGIAVYYVVATAEAASNLSRYDGVRFGHRAESFESLKDLIVQSRSEGFGAEVKRRIMLGSYALSSGYFDAYYSKAQFVRSKIQNEFLSALKEVDMIFTPVSPSVAFKLGERTSDPLKMYLSDVYTVTINLAGVPALAFPIAYGSDSQMPIGAQFIGAPFQEEKLFSAVAGFEKLGSFQRKSLRI